jgi:hypothetical protein
MAAAGDRASSQVRTGAARKAGPRTRSPSAPLIEKQDSVRGLRTRPGVVRWDVAFGHGFRTRNMPARDASSASDSYMAVYRTLKRSATDRRLPLVGRRAMAERRLKRSGPAPVRTGRGADRVCVWANSIARIPHPPPDPGLSQRRRSDRQVLRHREHECDSASRTSGALPAAGPKRRRSTCGGLLSADKCSRAGSSTHLAPLRLEQQSAAVAAIARSGSETAAAFMHDRSLVRTRPCL